MDSVELSRSSVSIEAHNFMTIAHLNRWVVVCLARRHFLRERGNLRPSEQIFCTPSPFYFPPTPRRVSHP